MLSHEKIVVVTKRTSLEEMIERFNTREQARFYVEHMGLSFEEYHQAHDVYHQALRRLKAALPSEARTQFIERSFLPTYTFGDHDLVVTLGPDGLVVNTAKYLTTQPLLALNPDPRRIDGVLIPFQVEQCRQVLRRAIHDDCALRRISMARAELNDGQTIHALNDLFIGQSSHVSARYNLALGDQCEDQSSSGIIVSTGAGSTGWLRSVVTGARRVVQALDSAADNTPTLPADDYRLDWEAEQLVFSVREPFISRTSGASLVFGTVDARHSLTITSHMPQHGVIFSDGIESDYLEFTSGSVATISVAEKKLHLIIG